MKKKSAKVQRRQAASSRKQGGSKPGEARGTRQRISDAARRSDALDLEKGVFTKNNPKDIAESLKRSAETSTRRKADPFRSALSMLNLYINRAGTNLSQMRRRILTRAKDELRKQFGRS